MACLAGPLALRRGNDSVKRRSARARYRQFATLCWFVCLPPPPRHVYGAERRLLLTYLLVAANMKTDEVDK